MPVLLSLFLVFASLATATYCPAGNVYTADSNLGPVTLMGIGNSITDTLNCPKTTTGVIDLTAQKASLQRGAPFSLSLTATTCGGGWARYVYAYIDYNKNEVFDADELVGQTSVGSGLDPIVVSFPINPPCGAVAGTTRMRTFVVESAFQAEPCLEYQYGGTKDFSIEILDQPGALCGGSDIGIGGGLSGGSIFLILFFTLIPLYFIVGFVYILKFNPSAATMKVFQPLSPDFWRQGLGYVKDGCALSLQTIQSTIAKLRGQPPSVTTSDTFL